MSDKWYIVNVEAAIIKDTHYLMIVRGEKEEHAPGTISMPGGKVENAANSNNILEETLIREIREEVGVEIYNDIEYVESKSFIADDNEPVIDIVFLCRYKKGVPRIKDLNEVSRILWMTAEEILNHPKTPAWIKQSIERTEKKRISKAKIWF